jgi:hypothetical protein
MLIVFLPPLASSRHQNENNFTLIKLNGDYENVSQLRTAAASRLKVLYDVRIERKHLSSRHCDSLTCTCRSQLARNQLISRVIYFAVKEIELLLVGEFPIKCFLSSFLSFVSRLVCESIKASAYTLDHMCAMCLMNSIEGSRGDNV